jgi:hypothetical protein
MLPERIISPANYLKPKSINYTRFVKKILKDCFENELPWSIINRPKQVFPIPVAELLDFYKKIHAEEIISEYNIPLSLHKYISSSSYPQSSKLLYYSYLNWLNSCRNILTQQ